MATKIIIDAGHGGYDGGATYNGRKEKDDNLALALAVGEILEAQGYDVAYTRTTDVYDSPVQKARIGNESGADFFVSIHRNSSPTPNQYNGVQTLVYNDAGLKATMAANVNKRLEEVGYRNINVAQRPDLAVLRRTRMPAILVEAGFINSEVDNNLFDSKFSETAEAIARGIDETLQQAGVTPAMATDTVENPYYGISEQRKREESMEEATNSTGQSPEIDYDRVPSGDQKYQILVGIYRNFGAASYQANRFINEGYDAEVYEDEGLYQVRVGVYNDIEEALISQREFRDKGYTTLIVRQDRF